MTLRPSWPDTTAPWSSNRLHHVHSCKEHYRQWSTVLLPCFSMEQLESASRSATPIIYQCHILESWALSQMQNSTLGFRKCCLPGSKHLKQCLQWWQTTSSTCSRLRNSSLDPNFGRGSNFLWFHISINHESHLFMLLHHTFVFKFQWHAMTTRSSKQALVHSCSPRVQM